MRDAAYGATVAKRQLSRELSTLRVATGYTANQVCDRLSWGRGKVNRIEANQWRRPEMSDIRDLLRLYDVPPDGRRRMEELAGRARARAWWRDYNDVFTNEFPGFEADASLIGVYMPLVLPGLLQTPAYMDAFMEAGQMSPEWRDRAREARLRRQEILDRDDGRAPELVAVITEASLMYEWGTREDRRAQIQHLVELGQRDGVEIRVLRFADGPHPGMNSLINLFEFADGPPIIFLETDVAIQELDDEKAVAANRETFQRIREAALDPQGTSMYLKGLAENLA